MSQILLKFSKFEQNERIFNPTTELTDVGPKQSYCGCKSSKFTPFIFLLI
jgi:hypothetical protein